MLVNGIEIIPVMNKISHGHMAAPRVDFTIDYSIFKKDPLERGKIWKLKREHKALLTEKFGAGTKQLNTTPPFYLRRTH